MNKSERPLVTFGLIAYNQERFIREAVEGALAQTYSPLEIILSDDCSTDRTFEIMKGLADGYEGSHRIKLRRNEKNDGICSHINRVWCESEGQWYFNAGGDDISHPDRVADVMRCVGSNPEIKFVQTYLKLIDERGSTIGTNTHGEACAQFEKSSLARWGLKERLANKSPKTHGACLAYTRELFDRFPPLPEGCIFEDNVLNWRGELLGTGAILRKELVSFRVHASQMTHSSGGSGLKIFDKKRLMTIRDGVCTTYQNIMDLKTAESMGIHEADLIERARLYMKRRYRYFSLRESAIAGKWPSRLLPLMQMLLMGSGFAPFSRDNLFRSLLPDQLYFILKEGLKERSHERKIQR